MLIEIALVSVRDDVDSKQNIPARAHTRTGRRPRTRRSRFCMLDCAISRLVWVELPVESMTILIDGDIGRRRD